ncbi:psbP domain-containing protein 5, chloroplastic-like isoform X3 [Punica granatum]|uniref:PsbP domain-containing protein 5, chloroplastic-like isoform X3 n=1 Tax=Punica granatum TaxID=22663 RepID=A0A6P8D3A5_PUNGR|nr:psbP domain-containing protein 5, chloroplastic-like isoform X3 [Punica granatum]
MVPLSPSPLGFSSSSIPTTSFLFFSKCRATHISKRFGLPGKGIVCAGDRTGVSFRGGVLRRELVLLGLSSSSSAALLFPSSASIAQEELQMASLVDEINAYTYSYPTQLPSKKFTFKWVESRKPERYSSAAPLSPDARLRIVSERVDIIDNLVISVSRVTSSQRVVESSVLDAHSNDANGEPYWYYEYLVRKSPTKMAQEPNLFRHNVASTAERDGYLYTLNASTLGKQWDKMGPFLEKTVASFRLLPLSENYVPPYKDPWRFW